MSERPASPIGSSLGAANAHARPGDPSLIQQILIRRGDTLADLVRKTGLPAEEIFAANPQLTRGRDLAPGTILRLPRPIPEPIADRLTRESPIHRRPGGSRSETATIGPQIPNPVLSNPYDDYLATLELMRSSPSAAAAAAAAARAGAPIASQRQWAERAMIVARAATLAADGAALRAQRQHARELMGRWEGRPVVAYREDQDFGRHVVRKDGQVRYKAFVTGQGSLRAADPEGTTTPIEHVADQSIEKKNRSPFISIKTASGAGIAYGSKAIRIDLARLRADLRAGKVRGVSIIEHEALIKLHHANVARARAAYEARPSTETAAALADAERARDCSIRDQEALIKGVLPARYFTRAWPARTPSATTYERRLNGEAAEIRAR